MTSKKDANFQIEKNDPLIPTKFSSEEQTALYRELLIKGFRPHKFVVIKKQIPREEYLSIPGNSSDHNPNHHIKRGTQFYISSIEPPENIRIHHRFSGVRFTLPFKYLELVNEYPFSNMGANCRENSIPVLNLAASILFFHPETKRFYEVPKAYPFINLLTRGKLTPPIFKEIEERGISPIDINGFKELFRHVTLTEQFVNKRKYPTRKKKRKKSA